MLRPEDQDAIDQFWQNAGIQKVSHRLTSRPTSWRSRLTSRSSSRSGDSRRMPKSHVLIAESSRERKRELHGIKRLTGEFW